VLFVLLSVNYVPPSPQENKMAYQNDFIDLEGKRVNIHKVVPSCAKSAFPKLPEPAEFPKYTPG
jgi:hypothetical protein